MAKQWRCAVIGTGVVGEWHVKVLSRKIPNATLVAVCDTEPGKAQKCLDNNQLSGVNVYTKLSKMLAKEQLDIVHVCTPSGDHMKPAITAMEAGVNVICEKPMEIRLDRIDKMIATAKKHDVRLAGIFQNRWNDANRALYDAAQTGRFGRIAFGGSYTPWYRSDEYYASGDWRGTWKLDGGGAIMNQSVHNVDLIQWICGPVKSVSAYASSRIHADIEVEDTLSCSCQFESGAFGSIVGSTAMWPGSSVRIEIGGENGTAVTETHLATYKFRDEKPEDDEVRKRLGPQPAATSGEAASGGTANPADLWIELHVRNIKHILESWEAGRDADTAGPEARKAVAIITAMYASAKKGGKPVVVK